MIGMPQLSITTAPLNILYGGYYADFRQTLKTMARLKEYTLIDGFELQDLAEWDARGPPRDVRTKRHRISAWENSAKYDLKDKSEKCVDCSILSLHANRDIGIYLCSEDEEEIKHGRQLLRETLHLASSIGATLAVFHLWDTWETNLDIKKLKRILHAESRSYVDVTASIENVPTHLEDHTPYDIVKQFDSITLDTRWAGMYDELDSFSNIVEKISNVHLRGSLEDGEWILYNAPYSFTEALEVIHNEWGYKGLYTLEPERSIATPSEQSVSTAINSLRRFILD